MRCTHCDAIIPDGRLHCPRCGKEVQIVPDYNPLEDVLTQEVKGSVEDATRPIRTDDIRNYRRREATRQTNSTRVLNQDEMEQIRIKREQAVRGRAMAEEKRRQQMMARKRKLLQRRRRMILIMVLVVLFVGGILSYILYQNSYAGQVKKGYNALQMKEYSRAENYFNRAIDKNGQKAEAYQGLARTYEEQEQEDEAESVFLSAIASYPSSTELYQAAISYYEERNELEKISELLSDCEDDKVLEHVKDYISEAPDFSLEEGKYSEVQEVTLSSDGGKIYYTDDGTEPTSSSKLYTEPILLKQEGETEIKAVSYNSKNIPSVVVSRTYKIEIPIADAPAVTPSTGQYSSPTQITIQVPEGYTAYYTTDGTEPNQNSTLYTGPIDMPEGQMIFSAVLVSETGKTTQITKRNYVYEPQ